MVTAAAAAFIVVRGIVGYVVNSAIRRRRFMHAFIVVRANKSSTPPSRSGWTRRMLCLNQLNRIDLRQWLGRSTLYVSEIR